MISQLKAALEIGLQAKAMKNNLKQNKYLNKNIYNSSTGTLAISPTVGRIDRCAANKVTF